MWADWMAKRLLYVDGVFYTLTDKVAGFHSVRGYHVITLNYKRYLRHRLVWSYHNGDIPAGYVVDHINGVPGDDRIENLRLCTHADNTAAGVAKLQATNTSGYNGVYWNKQYSKWHARCVHQGRSSHVGYFTSAEAAHAALVAYRVANGIEASRRL